MIKAVLFDFTQTLVDSADGFRAAEKQAQDRIFRDLSLTSREEFLSNYRKIRKEFHSRSNFSRKAMWQEVYWYYCHESDLQSLEKWEHDYWQKVKSETNLFPETEQVLEKLASKYRLALVTNIQAPGQHLVSNFPELEKFFEVIVIAGESAVPAKPDSTPFLSCLENLGVTAAEAVHVGDDWRIDICGARDAGIQPIWLQHHLVRRKWPAVQTSVPVITSLDRLLELKSILT